MFSAMVVNDAPELSVANMMSLIFFFKRFVIKLKSLNLKNYKMV